MKNFLLNLMVWVISFYVILALDWDVGTKMLVFAMTNSIAKSMINAL